MQPSSLLQGCGGPCGAYSTPCRSLLLTSKRPFLGVGENVPALESQSAGPIALHLGTPVQMQPVLSADNIWTRFVTVFHEDQDLLRKMARERHYGALYTTNYTGSTTAPLQYPDGRAEDYAM